MKRSLRVKLAMETIMNTAPRMLAVFSVIVMSLELAVMYLVYSSFFTPPNEKNPLTSQRVFDFWLGP